MSTIRELLIVALVMACGSRATPTSSPAPAEPAEPPTAVQPAPLEQAPPPGLPSTSPQADGGPCLTSDDCTSGICEGQGCDDGAPGRCAPKQRGCTRDLRPYCGCDGVTFTASGSCPGKRYKAPGACAATAP